MARRTTVEVVSCWNGGANGHYWELRWRDADGRRHRERTDFAGGPWTRRAASAALDLLESVYGLDRRSVRFDAGRA